MITEGEESVCLKACQGCVEVSLCLVEIARVCLILGFNGCPEDLVARHERTQGYESHLIHLLHVIVLQGLDGSSHDLSFTLKLLDFITKTDLVCLELFNILFRNEQRCLRLVGPARSEKERRTSREFFH